MIFLVLLALALAVAGCGAADSADSDGSTAASETETEETDTEEASEFDVAVLEASLKKSLSASLVEEVDCPDDVVGETGEKVTCDAAGESGLAGSVDVELMNDEGTAYEYKGELEDNGFTSEFSGTVTEK